jgi:ABC-type sulfate/molybdate transport systems ATPase subunit
MLVTHDPHEAAAVADRVLILHAGRVRQIGPARAVLDQPSDSECARVLGFENVIGPALATRLLDRPTCHHVAVRAADCRLGPDGETGTLERAVPFGAVTRAIVTIDDARLVIDAPDSLTALAPGSQVGVRIDADAARPLKPR